MVFFLVIVGINLFFFAFWIWKMYYEVKVRAILQYSKVYVVLCLCCNKRKLDRIKKQVILEREHELLSEEFFKIINNLKKLYIKG